ncbi:MAG TPA: lipoyl domain-containing protein, partial [Chthoniobacteraceae bacterium]|nr:lipoyl domain-containing protein [Chthoniobacteraceae bacterium]
MKPVVEVKVPVENVNDVTARLLHWRAESGAMVREGDLLAEMETTKAVFEIHAPAAGVLQYTWPREAEVPVGETL